MAQIAYHGWGQYAIGVMKTHIHRSSGGLNGDVAKVSGLVRWMI